MIKQFKITAPNIAKNTIMDIFRYLKSKKKYLYLFIKREMDRDDDGRISYKDFELAMQYIDDVEINKQNRYIQEKYGLYI